MKASLSGLREHAFLLDQLETLGGGATVAASILLDETAGGASVFDLVEAIGTRIGIESAARLQTIVANSLGSGWREAGQIQFSLEGARASLRFYRGEDVPTVLQPLPPEVKDVRFTVDLSSTPNLDLAGARVRGEFFAKVLPDASG